MANGAASLLVPTVAGADELSHGQRNALESRSPRPWIFPPHGLAVFHGQGETARLSHYFLPRLLLEGKQILFLDGANSADPRLLARLARERGVAFEQFNRRIQIARAFTCFQLTELIARVPQFLEKFPAQVLVVTAFPDLYFDGDIRDWDARVAFEHALRDLRRYAHGDISIADRRSEIAATKTGGVVHPVASGEWQVASGQAADGGSRLQRGGHRPPLQLAVFSSVSEFAPSPARKHFFEQVCATATQVWRFNLDEGGRARLFPDRPWSVVRGQLPVGNPKVETPRAGFDSELSTVSCGQLTTGD